MQQALTFHCSAVQQWKMRWKEHRPPVTTPGQNYLDRVYSSHPLDKNTSDLQPFIFKCLGMLPKQAGETSDVSLGVGRLQKIPPSLCRGGCPTCPDHGTLRVGVCSRSPGGVRSDQLHHRPCITEPVQDGKSDSAVVLFNAGIHVVFFGSGEDF